MLPTKYVGVDIRMRGISCLVVPIPGHAFFKQAEFERLFGDDFLQIAGFATQVFDLVGGG